MILLAPVALWLSVVGAGVVALYLLKVRRQRQTVPSLEFWRELAGQRQTRSLLQRLKRLLSLLLWLLILALLVLSLANPVFAFGRIKPRSIAVIVDNSASMQAIEDGATRLAHAVDAVERMTSGRPVRDEWLLIEAGREIRVARSWTHRGREIRHATGEITGHLGDTDLETAIDLAGQLLEGKRRPTIVLVTDGDSGEAVRLAAEREDVFVHPIGQRDDNVGITRLSVRPHRLDATQHAFVRVENAGAEPVEVDLVLEVDETTVSVEPIRIDGRGAWQRTLVVERPEGGILRASLDLEDALAADDEAFGVMAPIRSARVLLVSDPLEAFFFEQALGAMDPLVDVASSATIAPEDLGSIDWNEARPDLVILNAGETPAELPVGAVVSIDAPPVWSGARTIGELGSPRLEIVDREHPLMRFLEVAGAEVGRARRIELTRPADVLVAGDRGDPLVFLARDRDRVALCLAFDVLESDLPFRNSFPILLRNAVTHLVQERASWTPDQVRVGETLTARRPVPSGVEVVRAVTLEDAEERTRELELRDGLFRFDETSRPGPVRFEIGDEVAFAAVNVTSGRETRLAPLTLPDDAPRRPLSSTLVSAPPWIVLGAVALGLVLFEWVGYHMRWTE